MPNSEGCDTLAAKGAMKRGLSVLKITASVLLGFIFLVVLTGNLLLSVAKGEVLDEGFYKRHLEESNFYPRLYSEVLTQLDSAAGFYGRLRLSSEEVRGLFTQVFPEAWVRGQVEALLDNLLPWVRSDTDSLDLAIDLRPNKEAAREATARFITQKVGGLPQCRPGQEIDLGQVSAGLLPECIPPVADGEAIKRQAVALATGFVNENIDLAPDRLDLIDEVKGGGESRQEFLDKFQGARTGIKLATGIALPISYVALAILLLLIALLNQPWLKHALRWVGGTIFFSGGLLLYGSIYATTVLPGRIAEWSTRNITGLPGDVVALMGEVAEAATRDILGDFIVPAAIVTGIGLAIFVASFLVGREKGKPRAAASKRT